MAKHLHDQPWRWGAGAEVTIDKNRPHKPTSTDPDVPADMMLCAMEPDKKWNGFQTTLAQRTAALPPPPVSVAWDPDDPEVALELMAAISRDGVVILTNGINQAQCQRVIAEMDPYLAHAAEEQAREGGSAAVAGGYSEANRSTRVTALPARSEGSWDLITHPAIIDVGNALLGRQVLSMSEQQVARRMMHQAKQVPWSLHLSQMIRLEPNCGAQGLHRDAGYLELNLENAQRGVSQLEYEMTTIWALSDFTKEVGATRVVPGAPTWAHTSRSQKQRRPDHPLLAQQVVTSGRSTGSRLSPRWSTRRCRLALWFSSRATPTT